VPYAGICRSNQLRVDITAVDGGLEERMTYEPLDAFTGYSRQLLDSYHRAARRPTTRQPDRFVAVWPRRPPHTP